MLADRPTVPQTRSVARRYGAEVIGSRLGQAARDRVCSAWFRAEGAVALSRLRQTVPNFPTDADLRDARRDLYPAYEQYVKEVSSPGWAVSLETSGFLLALCRRASISYALDLGSGFSSYALRRWAAEGGAIVASVDDDHDWLARTERFLGTHGLGTERLSLWPHIPAEPFELVFHDLASGQRREAAMSIAVDHSRRFVVFDDAHHAGHRQAMRATCERAGAGLHSLRTVTKDNGSRFAMLALLPNPPNW
jgi:hypothetical protein